MNTLTVFTFGSPQAVDDALPRLHALLGEGGASIDDAAIAWWPPERDKPSTRSLGSLTGPGRLWGGFWGLLMGLIFLTPLAGPSFGAAAGAMAGSLADFGVEDDFVKRVRDSVTRGTSALFLVSSRASADRLTLALSGAAVHTIRAELSREQEQRLREALGEELPDARSTEVKQ